ncbi:unnamed protein product [Pedinophyceae sp. YPF-701]|nr:unnamed protein product [Pedinophyceae sp. YPF-701]
MVGRKERRRVPNLHGPAVSRGGARCPQAPRRGDEAGTGKRKRPQEHGGGSDISLLGCTAARRRDFGQDVDDGQGGMAAWMEQSDVRARKCRITTTARGRSAVATQDIRKGEVVVDTPDDMVLMPHSSRIAKHLVQHGLCHPSEGGAGFDAEVAGLTLALMAERSAVLSGGGSRWSGYVRYLPESVPDCPLLWSERELGGLAGTALLERLEGRARPELIPPPEADAGPSLCVAPPSGAARMYDELVRPFLDAVGDRCGLPRSPDSRDAFFKALSIVSGYGFVLGADRFQALVPYWDALNHVTGRVNVRLHHSASKGRLRMIAKRDIAKGEEVINSYGDLPNSELLRCYGFAEPRANPHDAAELHIANLFAASEPTAGKGADEARSRCSHGGGECAGRRGAGARPQWDLIEFLINQGIIFRSGWLWVRPRGDTASVAAALEAARLVQSEPRALRKFMIAVQTWRAPLVRPQPPGGRGAVLGAAAALERACVRRLEQLEGVRGAAGDGGWDGVRAQVAGKLRAAERAHLLRAAKVFSEISTEGGLGSALETELANFWQHPRAELDNQHD